MVFLSSVHFETLIDSLIPQCSLFLPLTIRNPEKGRWKWFNVYIPAVMWEVNSSFFINITYTFDFNITTFPTWKCPCYCWQPVYALDAWTASAHISPPPLVLSLESCLAKSLYFFSLYFLKGILMIFFFFFFLFFADFCLLHGAPLVK